MKAYNIIETNDKKNYKCLVIATTYVYPLDTFEHRKQLENELQERNLQGLVLFDLLLCNGVAPNRFIACDFKENKLNLLDVNVITDVYDKYKEISCRYLRENPTMLERSILPKAQIFLLKNGYTL